MNPYFILDKDLIKKMAFFNTDIEFDIYCLKEGE